MWTPWILDRRARDRAERLIARHGVGAWALARRQAVASYDRRREAFAWATVEAVRRTLGVQHHPD